LADRLGSGFLDRLPQETCNLVAGHLVRECAAVTSQELALHASSTDSLVELSSDIFARYVGIEGVLYVQSLYNAPSLGGEGGIRIFQARQGRAVRSVYVRYDHLGVRGVYFDLPRGELLRSRTRGVWWTEVSRETGILRVTAKTDVRLLWPALQYLLTHPGPEN